MERIKTMAKNKHQTDPPHDLWTLDFLAYWQGPVWTLDTLSAWTNSMEDIAVDESPEKAR